MGLVLVKTIVPKLLAFYKLTLMHKFATLLMLAAPVWVLAQVHPVYEGADIQQGEKLIAEHQCSACHQKKVGGDGSAMYRPAGRINTPGLLRGMVEQCNTELNLGLFPEEVNSIAAVLNRDHYRFK
jgi:hypothetical protein